MPLPSPTLPVLLYDDLARPEDPVCALALELDLRGYGKTDEEAVGRLAHLLVERFAEARQGRPEVLTFLAEEEFWERHERARFRTVLRGLPALRDRVADVPVPQPEAIAQQTRK